LKEFLRGKYLAVMMPQHHLACKDGYVYIHRLNAEKMLGRQLHPTEHVHHIDCNKLNNSYDNLMVFKTQGDHAAFHNGCTSKLVGDVYVCEGKSINHQIICPICNKNLMWISSKMCLECFNTKRKRIIPNKSITTKSDSLINYPTRDELKTLIRKNAFLKIGKQFGVSDNAIRKWCIKYNLPNKSKEIKNHSEEEWLLI
jgi:hypothetical protein